MRKKTLEELRANNRERQARWREKHLRFAKLKERNAARIRRGTMEPLGPPAPNLPLTSNVVAPNAIVPRETYYADEEGVDIGYGDNRRAVRGAQVGGGRDGVEDTGVGEEDREVGVGDRESAGILARGAGEDTMRAVERLAELVKRRAAGGLNAGVEVELEL